MDKRILVAASIIMLVAIMFTPGVFQTAFIPPERTDPIRPTTDRGLQISVDRTPNAPTEDDDVTILCTLSDLTVLDVILYYIVDGVESHKTMVGSGLEYSAVIPATTAGTVIQYYVKIGDEQSDIYSYVVQPSSSSTDTTTDVTFSADVDIYVGSGDDWTLVTAGGTLYGTIKIVLTVTTGAEFVDSAVITIWKQSSVSGWEQIDERIMVYKGDGVFELEYDTTQLENDVYDIRYELIDTGGKTVMEQSIFDVNVPGPEPMGGVWLVPVAIVCMLGGFIIFRRIRG